MLRHTTAVCLVLSAAPAWADISVDDAWATWGAQFRSYGLTAQASETRDGAALQIGDIRLSFEMPFGLGAGYLTMPGPRFEPQDDGTVRVTFPESSAITLGGTIKDEGSIAIALEMHGDTGEGVMSGEAGNVTSDWASEGMEVTLLDVVLDDKAAPTVRGPNVRGMATFGPLRLRNTTVIDGTHVTMTQSATYSHYDMAYSVSFPGDKGGTLEAGGRAENVVVEQTTVFPATGLEPLSLHRQLRDGLSWAAVVTADRSTSHQRMSDGTTTMMNQQGDMQDYKVDIRIDDAGVDYAGSLGGFSGKIATPEIPVPFALSGQAAKVRFLFPVLSGEIPQDVALAMSVNQFTIDEGLWALFDPGAELPRDPMDITLDLSGQVTLMREVLDIMNLIGYPPTKSPVMANAVTLNDLQLRGVGTEMTGTAAFTFDNGDWTTFDGMPRPEGVVDLRLTGANGLIDTLVRMGLIGNDDAMGARMGIGLIAKPAPDAESGADVLHSHIEIDGEGRIMANGMRVK